MRNAAPHERSPLFIATPDATRLDDVATRTFRAAPDDIARLGFAVAHEIDPAAPAVTGLPADTGALVRRHRVRAQGGEAPARRGRHRLRQCGGDPGGGQCRLGPVRRRSCRGAVPDSAGVQQPGSRPDRRRDAGRRVSGRRAGRAEVVIVLENDLYRRAERARVDRCFARARHFIVLDHLLHDTARRAEIVLPAGTFAEADGTLVSNEGRAQRFFQLLVPDGAIQESWRWLRDALHATGRAPELPGRGWTTSPPHAPRRCRRSQRSRRRRRPRIFASTAPRSAASRTDTAAGPPSMQP